MTPQLAALTLADEYGADGENLTPTGSDEWDECLDALCLLAAEVRRLLEHAA